jgi:hypothetical protein
MSDYEGSASIIRGSLATSGHAVPRHGLPVASAPPPGGPSRAIVPMAAPPVSNRPWLPHVPDGGPEGCRDR